VEKNKPRLPKSERGDQFAEKAQSVGMTLKRQRENCSRFFAEVMKEWKLQINANHFNHGPLGKLVRC